MQAFTLPEEVCNMILAFENNNKNPSIKVQCSSFGKNRQSAQADQEQVEH